MVETFVRRDHSRPTRRRVPFDGPNLMSCAGPVPAMALAHCRGQDEGDEGGTACCSRLRAEPGRAGGFGLISNTRCPAVYTAPISSPRPVCLPGFVGARAIVQQVNRHRRCRARVDRRDPAAFTSSSRGGRAGCVPACRLDTAVQRAMVASCGVRVRPMPVSERDRTGSGRSPDNSTGWAGGGRGQCCVA